ncbi:MAG: NADH-quinone oxidoreductase subunit J, partial [Candidatus Rokubacteria bacterium]|nr:NADH-quinone oxidoreductase subunit J [Candidatus Rokubacteria bacterium]
MESSIWTVLAFYVLAATIVGSALLVVCLRNIVHSVLWLAVCFIAMAGLFLTLDADFLAA